VFSVSIPTRVNSRIVDPDKDTPKPGDAVVYTRRGPLYVNLERAKRLAGRHLGRVTDVNTGRVLADYL
jgi:hypothetical protein